MTAPFTIPRPEPRVPLRDREPPNPFRGRKESRPFLIGTTVAPEFQSTTRRDVMRRLARFTTVSLVLLLLGVGSSDAQVRFGIRIGSPPPPRVIHVHPRRPGQNHV